MKIYQMIFATRGLTCKRTVFLRQLGPMSFWFLSWYKSLTSLRLSSILPFRSLCSCPQHLHFLSNPVARECQENAPGGRMTRGKCPFPCRGPMSVLRCTGVVNRNRQLGSSRVIKMAPFDRTHRHPIRLPKQLSACLIPFRRYSLTKKKVWIE